jgi:hypothetical protein
MAAQPAIDSLGDQIVLGLVRLFVIGQDGVRIAVRPLHIGEDQRPACLAAGLEMIGIAAAADDLGEGLFQVGHGVGPDIGHILQFLSKYDIHGRSPGLFAARTNRERFRRRSPATRAGGQRI